MSKIQRVTFLLRLNINKVVAKTVARMSLQSASRFFDPSYVLRDIGNGICRTYYWKFEIFALRTQSNPILISIPGTSRMDLMDMELIKKDLKHKGIYGLPTGKKK